MILYLSVSKSVTQPTANENREKRRIIQCCGCFVAATSDWKWAMKWMCRTHGKRNVLKRMQTHRTAECDMITLSYYFINERFFVKQKCLLYYLRATVCWAYNSPSAEWHSIIISFFKIICSCFCSVLHSPSTIFFFYVQRTEKSTDRNANKQTTFNSMLFVNVKSVEIVYENEIIKIAENAQWTKHNQFM